MKLAGAHRPHLGPVLVSQSALFLLVVRPLFLGGLAAM